MTEEKIAGIMREFVNTMSTWEVDKTLAFFTDDAIWVDPYGTHKGKEAIRTHLAGMAKNLKDMKITETGNGIVVHGEKAFFEHNISGIYKGKKWDYLGICAYEFSGDKIKAIRDVYDRLLSAQQVANGWFAKSFVNMIVRQTEAAVK